MITIIVSDIFGRSKALEDLSVAIDDNALIVDPYNKTEMNFNNEQSAYDCFTHQVGIATYSQHVFDVLKAQTKPVFAIGFSVGASALWNVGNKPDLNHITKAIGYYGSQIRHKPQIQPQFPIELILPTRENHFCIDNLYDQLINTANVFIRKTPYLHGFMNPLSDNFNRQGYDCELKGLRQYF